MNAGEIPVRSESKKLTTTNRAVGNMKNSNRISASGETCSHDTARGDNLAAGGSDLFRCSGREGLTSGEVVGRRLSMHTWPTSVCCRLLVGACCRCDLRA